MQTGMKVLLLLKNFWNSFFFIYDVEIIWKKKIISLKDLVWIRSHWKE